MNEDFTSSQVPNVVLESLTMTILNQCKTTINHESNEMDDEVYNSIVDCPFVAQIIDFWLQGMWPANLDIVVRF
jgi:hypothetical protein